MELVQNGFVDAATGLLTPSTPGFLNQTADLKFNPDAARKRLDAAGWKVGSNGIRAKNGQTLRIKGAFFANAVNQSLFEVIQQQVRDLGIEFIVQPVPSSSEYLQGQINGDYDVYRWHWSLADADVLRKDYSTEGINRLRLGKSNDIDQLLIAQAGITDPVRRKATTDEVQKVILDRNDASIRRSHYDHHLDWSFRQGGSVPPIWTRSRGREMRLVGITWTDEFQGLIALPATGIASVRDLAGRRSRRPY